MRKSLFDGTKERNKKLIEKLKNKKKATKKVSRNKVKAHLHQVESKVNNNFTDKEKQEYRIILDQQELYKYLTKDNIYAVDTESDVINKPDPMIDTMVGFSLYSKNNVGVYIPSKHKKTHLATFNYEYDYDRQLTYDEIGDVFREVDNKYVFHTATYDIRVFLNSIGYWDLDSTLWDVYIASRYLNETESSHSLKFLYDKYVEGKEERESLSFKELFKDINFSIIPIYLARLYGSKDARMTFDLYEFQKQYLHPEGKYIEQTGLKKAGHFFIKWEIPTIKAVVNMEERGIKFDGEKAKEIQKEYNEELNRIEKDIHDYLKTLDYSNLSDKKKSKLGEPINIGSHDQIRIVIYDVMKLKYDSRTTDAEALEYFEEKTTGRKREFFRNMLKHRSVSKLLSTYIEKMPKVVREDGKIHTKLNQVGADTGRFTSKDPNCYDKETEILTNNGWKLFKELNEKDKVAQWEENGEVSFVTPLDYIEYHYEGNMIKFDYGGVDLLVTPDHKMVSKTIDGNIKYEQAKEFNGLDGKIVCRKSIRAGRKVNGKSLTEEDKLELERAVAIQADGYIVPNTNRVEIRVQSERKKERLDKIFNEVYERPNGKQLTTRTLYIDELDCVKNWLIVDSENDVKELDVNKLLELDFEGRKFLLHIIHLWDGDYTREASFLQKENHVKTVDALQAVAVITGMSTSRYYKDRKYHVVNFHRKEERHFSRTYTKEIPYNDKVYCVTVPSGNIVVRRNNQVVISGNCQNIPSDRPEIRNMFRAEERKVLIATDYS